MKKESVHYQQNNIQHTLSHILFNLIREHEKFGKDISIICVGTDRSTGDCLGPLVGTKLSQRKIKSFKLYGTLQNPVHAKNIEDTIKLIDQDDLIIAIDASLGKSENIGHVIIYDSPIHPGSGAGKTITPVGDISMVGIVNMAGFMDSVLLQNTRLSVVMDMADIIEEIIYSTLERLDEERDILTEIAITKEGYKWCSHYGCWADEAEEITDGLGDCEYNCNDCNDIEYITAGGR